MSRARFRAVPEPPTPPAGTVVIYVDEADDKFKQKDDTGAVTDLTATAGLPVVDTTSLVKGSADVTKLMRIEVDGLTTATTRVATMPDKDITLNVDALPETFEAESNAELGNTTTTPVEKLKLTFTPSAVSDWDIEWSADLAQDEKAQNVEYQFVEDDTFTLNAGDTQPDPNFGGGYATFGGKVRRTLTAASHDFDIDFASSNGGDNAKIRNARIIATRAT